MDPSATNTESISRDHVVFEDYPGLITITGGKWTTYRRYGLPNYNYSLLVHESNLFDLFALLALPVLLFFLSNTQES
jgi:hypothetical protein